MLEKEGEKEDLVDKLMQKDIDLLISGKAIC